MIEWKHIRDEQPEHDMVIIQLDAPFEMYNGEWTKHYSIGMRAYYQNCIWQEFIDYCVDNDIPLPNFWWIYAKDFPFPKNS